MRKLELEQREHRQHQHEFVQDERAKVLEAEDEQRMKKLTARAGATVGEEQERQIREKREREEMEKREEDVKAGK